MLVFWVCFLQRSKIYIIYPLLYRFYSVIGRTFSSKKYMEPSFQSYRKLSKLCIVWGELQHIKNERGGSTCITGLKMKEVARHVSPEAREVAEWYMQKFNEKLIILGFLQMIGKWPCYLSCPIFELHAPNEIKKIKIRARHEDILNCKSIFDNKVGVMNIFKAYWRFLCTKAVDSNILVQRQAT